MWLPPLPGDLDAAAMLRSLSLRARREGAIGGGGGNDCLGGPFIVKFGVDYSATTAQRSSWSSAIAQILWIVDCGKW